MTENTDTTPAPSPYAAVPPLAAPPMNILAIVSVVSSVFFFSLVGIITGHLALNQIAKTGENGRTLALAGLIIGYVGISVAIFCWLAIFVFAAFVGHGR